MSMVNNGRVSVTDQKVDTEKFDNNFDEINWNSKEDKDEQPVEDK